jgi:hypothetical protein
MPSISPHSTKRSTTGARDLRQQGCASVNGIVRGAVAWMAVSTALLTGVASAQMGQTGMAPTDGLVNRATNAFRDLNLNGPGYLYYGINAADRGLGYRGSYMTLGGFIPVIEDDLGGIWSTDLRSHLSNYGGFFSNVGAVRKQLLGGGSLLGVGVYWDYDGDQNQYSDQTIGTIDPVIFPGGFSYNQVGVSGEFLTDWGNLRSNGYIPVGSTGQSTGRFASDRILCMQGINAALGGADLELGAYIPALADWAGMVSVGGYAYGNTRYKLDNGATLVPWFGGVYTRLDLTLANNWDFSLQYNNDSYFDSTGFARLTYRLGGSRRRNVPDQMEQPMMRNEHIVRAHQEAEVAINPVTNQPWRVIHVDNSSAAPGTGTITNPLTSLTAAGTTANLPYDVIFVHQSGIVYSSIADAPLFTFANSNQYLIGEGSAQAIPTLNCGPLTVSPTVDPSLYPTLSPRPFNTAIAIPAGVGTETISGFVINASGTGIDSRSTTGRTNTFRDLTINQGLTGIELGGTRNYAISNVTLLNQTTAGLVNNASGTVQLANATFSGIAGTALTTNAGEMIANQISIKDTLGDGVLVGGATSAKLNLSNATIDRSLASGIINSGNGTIEGNNVQITATVQNGLQTTAGSTGSIQLTGSTIDGSLATGGRSATGVLMQGDGTVTLNQTTLAEAQTGVDVTGNGQFTMNNGSITDISDTGIRLRPTAPTGVNSGSAELNGVTMANFGGNGISAQGVGTAGLGGNVSFINSSLSSVAGIGILGNNLGTPGTGSRIAVEGSTISSTTLAGIQVTNSNLRVERSTLSNNGDFGIESIDASTVLVSDSTFNGDTATGIQATANATLTWTAGGGFTNLFNSLTVTDSSIAATATGIGIQGAINTVTVAPAPPAIIAQGVVRADLSQNEISTATSPITLTTINGVVGTAAGTGTPPTPPLPPNITGGFNSGNPQGIAVRALSRSNLEALNSGAAVTETPTPPDPEDITTSVEYDISVTPLRPPQ